MYRYVSSLAVSLLITQPSFAVQLEFEPLKTLDARVSSCEEALRETKDQSFSYNFKLRGALKFSAELAPEFIGLYGWYPTNNRQKLHVAKVTGDDRNGLLRWEYELDWTASAISRLREEYVERHGKEAYDQLVNEHFLTYKGGEDEFLAIFQMQSIFEEKIEKFRKGNGTLQENLRQNPFFLELMKDVDSKILDYVLDYAHVDRVVSEGMSRIIFINSNDRVPLVISSDLYVKKITPFIKERNSEYLFSMQATLACLPNSEIAAARTKREDAWKNLGLQMDAPKFNRGTNIALGAGAVQSQGNKSLFYMVHGIEHIAPLK